MLYWAGVMVGLAGRIVTVHHCGPLRTKHLFHSFMRRAIFPPCRWRSHRFCSFFFSIGLLVGCSIQAFFLTSKLDCKELWRGKIILFHLKREQFYTMRWKKTVEGLLDHNCHKSGKEVVSKPIVADSARFAQTSKVCFNSSCINPRARTHSQNGHSRCPSCRIPLPSEKCGHVAVLPCESSL